MKEILNRFEQISDESFSEVSKIIKKKHIKKSFLIKKPKDFEKLFILIDGLARSVTIDQNGDKNTRSIIKPPALFLSLKNNIKN